MEGGASAHFPEARNNPVRHKFAGRRSFAQSLPFAHPSSGYEDVRRVFLLVERTRLCCCCCDRCEVFARRAGRALRTAGRALRPAGRAFAAVVRVFLAAVRTFAALARVLRPAGRAFWRGVRTFRGFASLGLPMTIWGWRMGVGRRVLLSGTEKWTTTGRAPTKTRSASTCRRCRSLVSSHHLRTVALTVAAVSRARVSN